MSSDQTTLGGFEWVGDPEPAPEPDADETPRWEPQRTDMCLGCGGHVSEQFRRVFGDNDDRAHACRQCVGQEALLNGAAADPTNSQTTEERVHTIGGGES